MTGLFGGFYGRGESSFYHSSRITLSKFLQLEKEEPETIAQELLNNLKSFQKILSTKDWNNDNTKMMIGVLVKSLEANGMNRVFAEILNVWSCHFHMSLLKYVQETSDSDSVVQLSVLFGHLLSVFPSSAVFILPLDALKNVVDEKYPDETIASAVDSMVKVCHALRTSTSVCFKNNTIELR